MKWTICVLVILVCLTGCRFSLFPAQKPDIPVVGDVPDIPGVTTAGNPPVASGEERVGEFPLAWALWVATVGLAAAALAAWKAPTLVDEILIATVGLIGVEVLIKVSQDVWIVKWKLMLLTVMMMAVLAGWKFLRRYLLPSPPSVLSSTPVAGVK